MCFSLNIVCLLKCAKRIRHKLNKLMKSFPRQVVSDPLVKMLRNKIYNKFKLFSMNFHN